MSFAKPQFKNRCSVRTGAAGRFEFPPEVEPFYIVVLDDQGYAMVAEEQVAGSSALRIRPWMEGNRTFRAEQRPAVR